MDVPEMLGFLFLFFEVFIEIEIKFFFLLGTSIKGIAQPNA